MAAEEEWARLKEPGELALTRDFSQGAKIHWERFSVFCKSIFFPQHAPKRKRELPKPQSLDLRHSNREFMNESNAGLGLYGHSSRSMNFPRLEGSPTHSEDSGDEGPLFRPKSRLPRAYPSQRIKY